MTSELDMDLDADWEYGGPNCSVCGASIINEHSRFEYSSRDYCISCADDALQALRKAYGQPELFFNLGEYTWHDQNPISKSHFVLGILMKDEYNLPYVQMWTVCGAHGDDIVPSQVMYGTIVTCENCRRL